MFFPLWFIVVGLMLVGVALAHSYLRRLPLTTAIFYLVAGCVLGPVGMNLIRADPIEHAPLLHRLAELAVIIALFSAGLKLRTPLSSARWRLPILLASVSMVMTVGGVAVVGYFVLQLPLGAAVLLGAVLAPTDPVLASDVQVEHAFDRDRLRFSLTGEAGLNDGTAFPFVMLGLGLLGLHDLGEYGLKWVTVDLLYATAAGLAIGAGFGTVIGRVVIHLRKAHRETRTLDDFLAAGLISLAYGTALMAHSYGFLSVFAAGLALRRVERIHSSPRSENSGRKNAAEAHEAPEAQTAPEAQEATHPLPLRMAQSVLSFSEQLERTAEIALVVLIGGLLTRRYVPVGVAWFIPLLLLVIRPAAVWVGSIGSGATRFQRAMLAWFGMRGIGSVYYLMYAMEHGLEGELARTLTALTLSTIAVSIVAHGTSVTPLMKQYAATE